MLKEKCDKQGIELFLYYSQPDWHHPDYFPRGEQEKGLLNQLIGVQQQKREYSLSSYS